MFFFIVRKMKFKNNVDDLNCFICNDWDSSNLVLVIVL